jgi:2-keto-4-pentenoate hydratase/2-oxohepta-3-ene-1,7-dioic acid hydratase in catechol pathway
MNYLQHNEELEGKSFKPEEPVVFTKADSSLLKDGRPFFLPEELGRIDYETELVVRICRLGKSIPERFAHRYYDAVTVGIDFTARDLQRRFKQEGRPWELCKGFDGAAAIGQWVPVEMFQNVQAIHFRLDITSSDDRLQGRGPVTVQRGCTSDMLYTVDQIVSYISRWFTLKTGDIIYTGTPTGVGPVHIDDHLEGWLEDRKVLEFNVK